MIKTRILILAKMSKYIEWIEASYGNEHAFYPLVFLEVLICLFTFWRSPSSFLCYQLWSRLCFLVCVTFSWSQLKFHILHSWWFLRHFPSSSFHLLVFHFPSFLLIWGMLFMLSDVTLVPWSISFLSFIMNLFLIWLYLSCSS